MDLVSNRAATAAASRTDVAATATAVLPFIGRVAIATIFILSGVSKLFAPGANIAYIESVGLPFPQLALAGAIFTEIVGGWLLVFGYRTRLVAAGLALFSIATALVFHNQLADQNQFIHFFKNIAMAGGLAQIVAFGAGSLAVDRRR